MSQDPDLRAPDGRYRIGVPGATGFLSTCTRNERVSIVASRPIAGCLNTSCEPLGVTAMRTFQSEPLTFDHGRSMQNAAARRVSRACTNGSSLPPDWALVSLTLDASISQESPIVPILLLLTNVTIRPCLPVGQCHTIEP